MSPHTESGQSPGPTDKVTFQDVVAYLHGVTDAVEALRRSCISVRPSVLDGVISLAPRAGNDATVSAADSSRDFAPDPNPKTRLTVRHGETAIELEGHLVVPKTPLPFALLPNRSGARFVDFEGADSVDETNGSALAVARGTLPYWAPAVSIAPLRHHAGNTERPLDPEEQRQAEMQYTAYSALALSLVPIAPFIPSGWPEEDTGGERVSGVHLRAAPLSAELYALTGTNDYSG